MVRGSEPARSASAPRDRQDAEAGLGDRGGQSGRRRELADGALDRDLPDARGRDQDVIGRIGDGRASRPGAGWGRRRATRGRRARRAAGSRLERVKERRVRLVEVRREAHLTAPEPGTRRCAAGRPWRDDGAHDHRRGRRPVAAERRAAARRGDDGLFRAGRGGDRAPIRGLRRRVALVRRRARCLLGCGRRVLRPADPRPADAAPRRPIDAGCPVVRGRHRQLRRGGLRQVVAGSAGPHRRFGASAGPRRGVGRAPDVGRGRRGGAPKARRAARRPGRGDRAEHPRGGHRPAGDREPRRHLVELCARVRGGQRHRPPGADRAQGPDRRRWLRPRRARVRPPRRRRGDPFGVTGPRADGPDPGP